MSQRVYVHANVFNGRIAIMRNLWEPSTEYQGKKQEKPSYMAGIVVQKTRANWFEEPVFGDFVRAAQELYGKAMSHIPFPQVVWPVKDGDIPEPGKAPAEWMRGHWYLNGSSSSPISVEMVQGGAPVKLMNRTVVKPGDFVSCGYALAVKQNDPRAVKAYLNTVLFMAGGEEIAVGNSVSGTELMAQAKAQGLNVTGFGSGAGGFGAGGFAPPQQQQGGFAPPPSQGGGFGANPNYAPNPGFAPHQPQPTQGGFGQAPAPVMPNQGFGAPGGFAVGANPAPNFGAGQPQGGFTPPQGGFAPPQGFPQQ